jgi:hypothetical protein
MAPVISLGWSSPFRQALGSHGGIRILAGNLAVLQEASHSEFLNRAAA